MLIKSSMVELETWDQCHFVMDWQGFPHDFFQFFWKPPKCPKIKLEVKKTSSKGALRWKYYFFKMLIKPSMLELDTWDQCHFVMDGQGFCHDFFSHFVEPPKCPPKCPKIKFEVKNGIWKYLFKKMFIKPSMIELQT